MGKEYDKSHNVEDFIADHIRLAPLLVRALKEEGSLCWQVGHHVKNGVAVPLDALVYEVFSRQRELFLRNRIIWTFGHGAHSSRRFKGGTKQSFGLRKGMITDSIFARYVYHKNIQVSAITKGQIRVNSAEIH
jgi:adenine-specific DNA-methyltransferase